MKNTTNINTMNELEFVIFCVESIAKYFEKNARSVYNELKDSGIIEYIISQYDMLHTQGKDYIIQEIIEVMKERGIKI